MVGKDDMAGKSFWLKKDMAGKKIRLEERYVEGKRYDGKKDMWWEESKAGGRSSKQQPAAAGRIFYQCVCQLSMARSSSSSPLGTLSL